ncbi:hypothetical protein MYSTI_00671 [Myxococcus stipitatus DSM 14675]|uniref:Lipoprotein n=1 Tax=Myxococcus stipitatus (strain DSM 14675 / JCM 12634 / Mx s8) TaxID=1278073 RepID=L7TZT4_MYXSD|nr:hypothetical protein [Myxococcus stipitatus]AGC42021.1 hypothetical protein MYSTI_00671 [Myxococcus stipitatus DSM 14675]
MAQRTRTRGWVLALFMLGCGLVSCAHASEGSGGGFGRNSAEARITHLISDGQFAEAEALVAESASSGLIEQSAAATFRRHIADLSMKLGEIPARLQRVSGFPSRLKDFTRHELQRMYDAENFTLGTKKELQTALKLLKDVAKDQSRLLQKL